MTYQDLFVTPIVLFFLYLVAFWLRPKYTDVNTRRYFIPALSLKFFGALMVGVIYQFYYGGGDTFSYFTLGSKFIWEAFWNRPFVAFSMIFGKNEFTPSNFDYASQIMYFLDGPSYAVVRLAGLIDIFTFHTYTATAIVFAFISFSGIWLLYLSFLRFFPNEYKALAYTVLFVPSVFFWGSGLLKDTITIGALGWLFYGITGLVLKQEGIKKNLFLIIIGLYSLYNIKIYILLCFLPALLFWFFLNFKSKIRNAALRVLAVPILIIIGASFGVMAVLNISQLNEKYSVENILYTAEETGRWIHYVSDNEGGSSYSFGDYDFSPIGLLRKFIPATATTFFRPFIWEVRNPVMLLAALENSVLLYFFILILLRVSNLKALLSNPMLLLCIVFSVAFGFAIGVTSFNFGSLVRYKIPILPFLFTSFYFLSRKKVNVGL